MALKLIRVERVLRDGPLTKESRRFMKRRVHPHGRNHGDTFATTFLRLVRDFRMLVGR